MSHCPKRSQCIGRETFCALSIHGWDNGTFLFSYFKLLKKIKEEKKIEKKNIQNKRNV